ncbi:MAG: toll/interleukin-1 receptor domain-containing protein, partial [bacterium]|nr:toll/interleukin-1 receptor domain-containing protein [bacterium]
MENTGNVFISYSHKDEKWKDRVMAHMEVLDAHRDFTLWNDRKISDGKDWFREIENALNSAQVVIMMISSNFLRSGFIKREELPRILTRRRDDGVVVIPLVLEPCAWKSVPWLAALQLRPKDGKPLSTMRRHKVDEELAALVNTIASLNKGKETPPPGGPFIPVPPGKVSLSRLPVTGAELFGREKELKLLDDAWAENHTHIVTLIAWGGVGKTALVNHWLNRLERENYRGARRVFGWSFYSQGAEQGKQASADQFRQEPLKWFGDKDPESGAAEEKGRRLAEWVTKEKTLLILDGMEPLQYPPGELRG